MSVERIVKNYLVLLGVSEPAVSEMLSELKTHPYYPSLNSIVDCFENWQFECVAAETTMDELQYLGRFFIAYVDSSFVLVTSTDNEAVVYLTQNLAVVYKTYQQFAVIWEKIIFKAEITSNSGKRIFSSPANQTSINPKISDLIAVAFNQEEPIIYKFFRRISIYFSYLFVRLHIKPNLISTSWFIAILGASFVLALGTQVSHRLIAVALLILHFILDCSDGEIARITRSTSAKGSNLEQVYHWVANLSMIAGVSLGLYSHTWDKGYLELGLFTLLADACFHFLYIELNYWTWEQKGFRFLARFSSLFYHLMPININLLILACISNRLDLFLWIWLSLSGLLFLCLSIGYFGPSRIERK